MQHLNTKTCYACKVTKPLSDFYKSNVNYYQKECKLCTKKRKGAWHKTEEGKLSSTRTKLKARFGITLEYYNLLYDLQKGKCLVCNKECSSGHKLSIDHDHKTGKIRGLLCKMCNVGIGNFKDSPELLRKAANYLENSKCH